MLAIAPTGAVSISPPDTSRRQGKSVVLQTQPGETVPIRIPVPPLWRQGSILALERAHLAFHRTAEAARGGQIVSQKVTVSGPLGTPLDNTDGSDIRAKAETISQTPQSDGSSELTRYQEWAAFVGLRNLLLGAGWARIVRTAEPFVRTSGAGMAAVLQTRSAIDALKSQPPSIAASLASIHAIWGWVKHPTSPLWSQIEDALSELQTAASALLAPRFFDPEGVVSRNEAILQVLGPTGGSDLNWVRLENVAVEVRQAASGMAIRSGALPAGPLGLQGSIFIGSKELAVAPADTATAIVQGINGLGEGVTASLDGNRMVLASDYGVVAVGDPNGVLQAMGFFDASGAAADVVRYATPAVISTNGVEMQSWDGRFTLDELGIEVMANGIGSTSLYMGSREDDVVAGVERFVEAYNEVIRLVNRGLAESYHEFPRNLVLQGIEAAAVSSLLGSVQGLPDEMDEAEEVGIDVSPGAARQLDEIMLQAGAAKAAAGGGLRFGSIGLPAILETIGVIFRDDYTATFDKERFLSAFRADAAQVGGVFAQDFDGGIAGRIKEIAETSARPATGLMDMTAETAARLAVEKPWLAYARATRDSLSTVFSLLV